MGDSCHGPEAAAVIAVDKYAKEYADLLVYEKRTAERKAALRELILEEIEKNGTVDDKGHQWLNGSEWVLKREKRVKHVFDEAAALTWADEMGIHDDVVVTITPEPYDQVDQDALSAYAFIHKDQREKVKSFYEDQETWALASPKRQNTIDY